MMRSVAVAACLAVLAVNPAIAGTKAEAYKACVKIIAKNLTPTGKVEDINFPKMSSVDASDADEFYFALRSGTIKGASRKKVDWLTGSKQPSASCGGSLAGGVIEWVTVNGNDVISAPVKF